MVAYTMTFDPRTDEQLQLLCDARNRAIGDILIESDGVSRHGVGG